ncbi:MAG: hypothetical protein KJO05_06030 [Bacteroidia bacterium]|nr:hypothetical protein [Bacteroidia bacterium]NNF32383.1 hypothetical protein [Flavobacteriaceae bacterium]MBT8275065.1 hypothetical protein [Bacteroidia bacterium]NNJ81464.1 hypothetical protein [Flavobacteriaceae bacterium]NNK55416.1 hypothetical protein [Flavobacteriaceae bacterium]
MKKRIFMYLFFFAVLFILFQYMNEKTIFESQENKINSLTKQVAESDSINNVLTDKVAELDYFTLLGNENAMTYIENLGMDAEAAQGLVTEAIYESNFGDVQNPLVPIESQDGKMRINKVKFLNHRWILADFTDGTYWGEVLIEYFFDDNNQLLLTPIGGTLYPN